MAWVQHFVNTIVVTETPCMQYLITGAPCMWYCIVAACQLPQSDNQEEPGLIYPGSRGGQLEIRL